MATAAAASQFTGVDFLDFDSLLSEEERAVRDTVRTWVDEHLMPVIGEAYIEGKFPKQLIPGMAELGLFGANLPEEYGCAGLNNVAYGLIMQELERGDSGIRSFASVQGALVMYPIYAFGSEEQKKHWLPLLASGQEIGCFGLTEPDFGSNPGGMITTARETKDGWVLNGTKMWITNGSQATVSIIWAKTGDIDDSEVDPRLHRARPTPRASRPRTRRGSSRSARSDTSEIHLAGRAPAQGRDPAQVGRAQEPAHVPHPGALRHRLGRHRRGDGVLRRGAALRRAAGSCSTSRSPATQIQQVRLVDMLTEITKAQLLTLQLGRLKDAGTMTPEQVSLCQAEQREHGLRHAPARRAGCSAPTASWSSTTRCGTWPTSSRSTPTRARTTCTRSSSARRSRGCPPSGDRASAG